MFMLTLMVSRRDDQVATSTGTFSGWEIIQGKIGQTHFIGRKACSLDLCSHSFLF